MNGVYVMYRGSTCVYVGQSVDIRGRLLDHLGGDNSCINRCLPSTVYVEAVAGNPSWRETQLIRQLRPVCNIQQN
jgi:hypothetical protein